MAKAETEEKRLARKAKEAKELERRKKELAQKNPKGYLWYLLVVLSIVYIVDEITSAMGSSMQPEVVTDFFVNRLGMEYNAGVATFTAMSAPVYSAMILMPFYKALADKYGRKLFLVLNTIGMLSLCICAPFMFLAILILITKVHETKGIDLNTVTGEEWD